jgi:hypothetical protein
MATKQVELRISPPKFTVLTVEIEGLSPYMQLRFSEKAKGNMKGKMEAGSTARGKRTRDARDFQEDLKQAQYIGPGGWNGIPATAFRNASIDVCRMVGFKMTHARMSIFIEADGFDLLDGTPLVKLESPSAPELTDMAVRNATGVADIRIRPMWREWSCKLRVRFDEDQFTAEDVINLLNRAGQQVGVGEGRPFSKNSNGLGMGMFTIKNVF